MNVSGRLYGPCHGILHTALLNRKWQYTREVALITCLPQHIVEAALAQMIEAKLVEYDSTLKRYKLKHQSERALRIIAKPALWAQKGIGPRQSTITSAT